MNEWKPIPLKNLTASEQAAVVLELLRQKAITPAQAAKIFGLVK